MKKYIKTKKTKSRSVIITITTIILAIFIFYIFVKSLIQAQKKEENFDKVKVENFKSLSKKL